MSDTTRTMRLKMDADARGIDKATKDAERDVDRFTKSVDKKFRDSGDKSGKNFNQGLKKWFSPSSLGKVGQEGGTVFGSGFLGMLKTPVLGPAIIAALGGAVAVALPAVGAIAASGLVFGFGAGLAGLGLVTAAKSKPVKAAWSKTLDEMGADTTRFSRPYEKTLISISGFTKRTFARFAPSLEASFKETAPVVTRFVDQVARGLEGLQPAVRPLSEAFTAVLDSLGPAIQGALGNVSDGLIRLSESVKKNPDGLADLVDGLGGAAEKGLDLVAVLNDANGKIKDFTGGTSAVDLVLGGANTKLGQFVGLVKDAIDPLSGLKNGLEAVLGSADKTTGAVGLTGDAVKYYTQGLDDNQVKAILAGKSADGLAPKVESLAVKFDRQWAATQKANQELFRNSGLLLTLSGSQISYQAAVDAATESIKQNGRTHDINTEKGRANKAALDQIAASANSVTEASRNSGKASVASATSARAAYEKQAIQMGYTKAEAKRMAAEFVKIPPKVTADFKGDITDLDAKIRSAKTQLKDPKLSATKRAHLEATIAQLLQKKREAQAAINALHGKTVPITITYKSNGIPRSFLPGSSTPGRSASGGPVQPRRTYLVGERGPEFLTMGNQPGRVTSAEAGIAPAAGPQTLEVHIEIGGEVVRVVRTEIKAADRDTTRRQMAGVRV
ncbi:MAG TPA: hypothetical protein VIQ30_15225 [Pseudonocardia sp.]